MGDYMKNKSPLIFFLSILLIASFILPLAGATITPILSISVGSDVFGGNKYNLQNQIVIVNNQGTLTTYYLKGDSHIYVNIGNSESVFYTGSSTIYGIAIIGNALYAYGIASTSAGGGFTNVDVIGYKINLNNGALISSVYYVLGTYYYNSYAYKGSGFITNDDGQTFTIFFDIYITTPSTGTTYRDYAILWNPGANTMQGVTSGIAGDSNNKYIFPFLIYSSDGVTPSNNTGFLVYDNTNVYILVYNPSSNTVAPTSYSIGSAGVSFTYPVRIIEDTLQYNLAGILVGRLTIEGCPASGNGMEFMNWYSSGGSSLSEETHILNLPASNLQLPSMGNVWAYHTGSNTVALSFVAFNAGRVIASDLYLASIQYGNDNTIVSTSAAIEATATWGGSQSIYPINDYAAWDYEMPYYNYGDNYLTYWQDMNGYFPFTSGNVAIEFDTIPFASTTQIWTLQGLQSTSGITPNTTNYQYGQLDYSGGFMNMTVGDYYFIKDTYMSQITIEQVAVVLNDNNVNSTNYHTFQLLIYTGDTPSQYPNSGTDLLWYGTYNTTQNGTAIYGDLPNAVKQLNQDVRFGIRSLNLNLDGDPLQIGYGSSNVATHDKPNTSFTNISMVDFTSDGGVVTPPLAIDFIYQGSQGGGGNSTITNPVSGQYSNGSYVLNYSQNTSTNLNGTQINQPSTPTGDYLRNLGTSNGIGDTVGLFMAIGLSFAFIGAFAYVGKKTDMGTGNAFQLMLGIGVILGFAITFAIGALDLMYFALLIVGVVAFASLKTTAALVNKDSGSG